MLMQAAQLNVGLLYYVAGDENIFAIVLDRNGAARRFTLLGWAEAFPRIDELIDAIDGSYSPRHRNAQLERFASEWGKSLLPPSDVLQQFDVLVIVQDHSLHRLPFHVVHLEGEEDPLGVTRGVTYCSSGTLFCHAVSRNVARNGEAARPAKCIAVAEDVLHDRAAAYRMVAQNFAEFFAEFKLSDYSLSRTTIKQASPGVLCIVCHGQYDEIDPSNGGLLLNNKLGWGSGLERPIVLGNGAVCNFRDLPFRFPPLNVDAHPKYTPEFLTVDELKVDVECQAELVALLGCATAAASPASLDEPGSFAEQWLRLGAPTVLANLWECDAVVASKWCRSFLNHWLVGRMPKALAWAAANREIRNMNPSLSPFDWGTLTLWGDWL
ncbi:MAG: hypothetical protein CV089_04180 [Nitrospira sp. WS110]|nr:hypothetical protein [Nitrospira sp. WS110]